MTEADWLTVADPDPMLVFLRGKADDRKLRLFAVGCCREVWPQLTDERSRRSVEVAERFADGRATGRELATACRDAMKATRRRAFPAAWAAYWTCKRLIAETVWNAAAAASDAGERGQAHLLREIFGNPFRPIVVLPSWLTWNDGAVRKIARAIYDGRNFGDLPILADALEDAGCMDADLLAHCRQRAEHVRGCFAVDGLIDLR